MPKVSSPTADSTDKKIPGKKELPKGLKAFTFHGIRFHNIEAIHQGHEQGQTDCPFCGRENRFYVNCESSQWDCKICGLSGNSITFIRKLWTDAQSSTTDSDLAAFAKERGLTVPNTLSRWGICLSPLSNKWLAPGFGVDGKLNTLYKYSADETGKMRWKVTSSLNHHLCGPITSLTPNQPLDEIIQNKGIVYVCEGLGDGMVLWEVLSKTKHDDDGNMVLTSNPSISLLADAAVIAVPGSNVFNEAWATLLGDKKVILMYDNDYPRKNPATGALILPASYAGMKRATEIMIRAEEKPAEAHYLQWGNPPETYADATLPHGYDVKDALTNSGNKSASSMTYRIKQLKTLFDRIRPIPSEWIPGHGGSSSSNAHDGNGDSSSSRNLPSGGLKMELLPCTEWKELINSWRKSMKWTEGLDRALSVMLATVTSTKAIGDQLWCKIIGPPSCGKSTLCEALSTNDKYILAKSTIRGFHSGYKSDKDGDEDNSLIAKVKDMTLITKDGDTLLQAPNFKQILSEARDIYDKTSRTHYRHALSRDYNGINMTWILCGTSSLREIDESELGARFIDCVIMEGIDDDLEDEVLWRVANKAERGMSYESTDDLESHVDVDMHQTMQLTGGYVDYLRKNARQLLEQVKMSDAMKRYCMKLGKFVAYARARPSKRQGEVAEREFGSRLVGQLIRLAKCLAVVLNRDEVDPEVMRRVKATALDTSRGRVLEVIKYLARRGDSGALTRNIENYTHEPAKELKELLRFLAKIQAIEVKEVTTANVVQPSRWKLTDKMRDLYQEITKASEGNE